MIYNRVILIFWKTALDERNEGDFTSTLERYDAGKFGSDLGFKMHETVFSKELLPL